MALIKKLTKQGNSYSLIIDKALIELLDIDPETPLQLSTNDGESLTITPLRDEIFDQAIDKKTDHYKRKYRKTFKRLSE